MVQALGELLPGIGQHELDVQLLDNAEKGLDPVGLHADANHDDARCNGGALHDLLDDARHADAFEDHRRTQLRAQAKKLSVAAAVVAFRCRGLSPGVIRRHLGWVDHDVGAHL